MQNLIAEIYTYRVLRGRRELRLSELSATDSEHLDGLEAKLRSPIGPGGMRDRREFVRRPARGEVRLFADGSWQPTVLRNISGGGFAIDPVEGAAAGDFVKVRIVDSDLSLFEFPAHVVGTNRGSLGCAFVGVPRRLEMSPTSRAHVAASLAPPIARGTGAVPIVPPEAVAPPRERRARVNLKLRFSAAGAFVEEYAHNLSCNGLFVGGAQDLAIGSVVSLELDLPGFRRLEVDAKVVHTTSTEQAAERGVRAGAGLQIVRAPDGYAEILAAYLKRLGRRRECVVVVTDPRWRAAFADAGFTVAVAEDLARIKRVLEQSDVAARAIIVPRRERAALLEALGPGAPPALGLDLDGELDDALNELDGIIRLRLGAARPGPPETLRRG